MNVRLITVFGFLLLLSGCTWISLTAEGEKVQVKGKFDVAGCNHLGKTTATVTDKVIGLQRKEHIIRDNLETLARNAAADMGGDTIVPIGKIKEGRQSFKIYKCKR